MRLDGTCASLRVVWCGVGGRGMMREWRGGTDMVGGVVWYVVWGGRDMVGGVEWYVVWGGRDMVRDRGVSVSGAG